MLRLRCAQRQHDLTKSLSARSDRSTIAKAKARGQECPRHTSLLFSLIPVSQKQKGDRGWRSPYFDSIYRLAKTAGVLRQPKRRNIVNGMRRLRVGRGF